MITRSASGNSTPAKQQPQSMAYASMLGDLYLFVRVIEAGSFSAAAERTGIAKSSLSRRLMQLEKHLDVQVLNRSTRTFAMTAIGERIYRHALDMLAAAEAAESVAQEANSEPSGLIRIAAPAILGRWLIELLSSFQNRHPKVQFALTAHDAVNNLTDQRLDIALTLDRVPLGSSDIVARPLARLPGVIVGSPGLIQRLGRPKRLAEVEDAALIAFGLPHALQPWRLSGSQRTPLRPAFCAESLATLKEAACAGLGLACLPLATCHQELTAGALALACEEEKPAASTLYTMTSSYRGTTQNVRNLISHLRIETLNVTHKGVQPLTALAESS